MKIHEIRELKDDELIKQIAEEQKSILIIKICTSVKTIN